MKIQNFTGIIIKKRQFMEADLIITVLCNDGMPQELIAKGASNGKSRRKNHIELMNLVSGTFYEGKTHTYLQDIACKNSFHKLKENLDLIMKGQVMLEIIQKAVLHSDPHKAIYDLLETTFQDLNQDLPHALTYEAALTKLAHHLGFLPNFKECSTCHSQITEDEAKWDPSQNTLYCKNCAMAQHRSFPLKYRKALEFFRHSESSDLGKISIQEDEHRILQEFLPNLFLTHFGQPLKTLSYEN